MRRLHSRSRDFLRARLGPGSAALPFAEAVVAQVAHPLGVQPTDGAHREERVAQRVADLLHLCERPAGAGAAVGRLSADPALISAFFQNADLLFEHSYAHAEAVGVLTLEALHRAQEEGA